MWFCPECYLEYDKHCACQASSAPRVAFSAPGEFPLLVGHLTLLDNTPSPRKLLQDLCDGPLLYASTKSRCCCWRHRANTLWAWQARAEDLPLVGAASDNAVTTSLLRIILDTGLLLIDAPQATPLFFAHYARNQPRASTPPALGLLIDRLQWTFSLARERKRAIALFDAASSTSAEERSRLASMSEAFNVFTDRADAFRWLLENGRSSRTFRSTPRYQVSKPNSDRSANSTPGLLKTDGVAKVPQIGLIDLGGTAARQMLARIHRETYLASINNETDDDSQLVNLPGVRGSLSRLQSSSTTKNLRYGLINELRNGHLTPGASVPSWMGQRVRWWWVGTDRFALSLREALNSRKFDSLILGIGDSRFFGERELALYLSRTWRGCHEPAALVVAQNVNADLLRWVRYEFPETPELPDSWEGGMHALEMALRVAQKRLSV